MDQLIELDRYLTLMINGWHSAFWDQFFFVYTKVWVWVPFYAAYMFIFIKQEKKQAWMFALSMILVVCIADQTASGILKPLFERLRPSHDPLLENLIHTVNGYRGGRFGFVSSHAANSAGVALFLSLLCHNRLNTLCLIVWAFLTSYSRIYLGVHFVGDIAGGVLVGFVAAFAGSRFYLYLQKKMNPIQAKGMLLPQFPAGYFRWPICVYIATCAIMLLISV